MGAGATSSAKVAVEMEPQSLEEHSMDDQCMRYAPPDPGFWEKGNISNMITFVFMAAGLALRVVFKDD